MLRVYTKRVNYVGNRGRHESASIFKETVDTWNEFPSVRRRRQWPVTAAVVISPENRIGQTPDNTTDFIYSSRLLLSCDLNRRPHSRCITGEVVPRGTRERRKRKEVYRCELESGSRWPL